VFGGAVFGNDDVIGEPDDESGADGRVGWLEQAIPLYPYVPCLLLTCRDIVFLLLSLLFNW